MSFCFFNVGLSLFARLTRGRGKKKKKLKTHHVDLHRRRLADLAVPGGVVVVVHRDGPVGALGLLHAQQQAVDELGAEALGALAEEVVHDLAAAHADVLGLGEGAAVGGGFGCFIGFRYDPSGTERKEKEVSLSSFSASKTDPKMCGKMKERRGEKTSTHPTSTSLLEGEIIFILVTLRSMISAGMSNSSTMQSGMAPPQGCLRVGVVLFERGREKRVREKKNKG